ncbi:hypothetical protein Tco_0300958 [Tanacetum coccineum]
MRMWLPSHWWAFAREACRHCWMESCHDLSRSKKTKHEVIVTDILIYRGDNQHKRGKPPGGSGIRSSGPWCLALSAALISLSRRCDSVAAYEASSRVVPGAVYEWSTLPACSCVWVCLVDRFMRLHMISYGLEAPDELPGLNHIERAQARGKQ